METEIKDKEPMDKQVKAPKYLIYEFRVLSSYSNSKKCLYKAYKGYLDFSLKVKVNDILIYNDNFYICVNVKGADTVPVDKELIPLKETKIYKVV